MTWLICPHAGKQRFPTKAMATRSRQNKRSRERDRGQRGYVYQCPDCGDWHLTRVPPEKFKHRRAS